MMSVRIISNCGTVASEPGYMVPLASFRAVEITCKRCTKRFQRRDTRIVLL